MSILHMVEKLFGVKCLCASTPIHHAAKESAFSINCLVYLPIKSLSLLYYKCTLYNVNSLLFHHSAVVLCYMCSVMLYSMPYTAILCIPFSFRSPSFRCRALRYDLFNLKLWRRLSFFMSIEGASAMQIRALDDSGEIY